MLYIYVSKSKTRRDYLFIFFYVPGPILSFLR